MFIPDAPPKVSLILPQLAFQDLQNIALLGTNLWHDPRLIEMAGKHASGAIIPDGFFAESLNPAVQEFTEAFQLAYGETPGFLEAVAYDSATMVLDLIAQGAMSREAVRKGLSRMETFNGVTGPTRFNADGDAIKYLTLLRIEGDRFIEIVTP